MRLGLLMRRIAIIYYINRILLQEGALERELTLEADFKSIMINRLLVRSPF